MRVLDGPRSATSRLSPLTASRSPSFHSPQSSYQKPSRRMLSSTRLSMSPTYTRPSKITMPSNSSPVASAVSEPRPRSVKPTKPDVIQYTLFRRLHTLLEKFSGRPQSGCQRSVLRDRSLQSRWFILVPVQVLSASLHMCQGQVVAGQLSRVLCFTPAPTGCACRWPSGASRGCREDLLPSPPRQTAATITW